MDKMQVVEFPFDIAQFPTSLYGGKPFHVGNVGLELPCSIKTETERLIKEFLGICQFGVESVYLRLDLFVDPNLKKVHLLEINSRLVDGWGTAFSLSQAGGQRIEEVLYDAKAAQFPALWHLPYNNEVYRNDFDFALRELNHLGVSATETAVLDEVPAGEWLYYYGWDRPKEEKLLAPCFGYEIEDKIHLTRFSRAWQGEQVKIPLGYSVCKEAWEDIPRERVIFKFCEKYGKDSKRARTSVLYPKEVGKGRFARQCYMRGTIVAQDLVAPFKARDERICQLVLLTSGARVITGYVIWAPLGTRVITDAYEHAPLIWS